MSDIEQPSNNSSEETNSGVHSDEKPKNRGGRPFGSKSKQTVDALRIKQKYQDRVRKNIDRILNAQLTVALGAHVLYVVYTDSEGHKHKPEQIRDADVVSDFLEENGGKPTFMNMDDDEETGSSHFFYIQLVAPNQAAIGDMLDRSIGKAEQKLDLTTDGESLNNPYAKLSIEELKQLAGK